MFASGWILLVRLKVKIDHIRLFLNSLGNEISSYLLKIPKYILNNLCSLHLRGIEVDVCCWDNLVLAIPNFINLKKFLFHDNYFKEGEQKHFIEVLCHSKSLQHVSFSRFSPDKCIILLTNLYTLHTIELYQLSSFSIYQPNRWWRWTLSCWYDTLTDWSRFLITYGTKPQWSIPRSHNPFTERTISRLVCELSYCHPKSSVKLHLSFEWQDYIQSVSAFPGGKKHILFGRSVKVNNLPKHLLY